MSKAPYKHPSVFVGCPYKPKKTFERLRQVLGHIPLEFVYADSSISTQHVLERIRRGITRTDYSLFDITGWNPNVTLEVGLAEGLNKPYYILFRPGRGAQQEPPADLKGVQRFQYKNLEAVAPDSLAWQLTHQLVRTLTHPRYIYDELSGDDRDKMFFVAMRILAYFKTYKILLRKDLKKMARGTWLREQALEDILRILKDRGLIKGRLDGQRWRPGRELYKRVTL